MPLVLQGTLEDLSSANCTRRETVCIAADTKTENGEKLAMNQKKEQYRKTLCGSWKLESADKKTECIVTIPGSVLSGMTEQGILTNPYNRMNEYPTRDFLDQDFIFSRTFELEKQVGLTYELCCDGIDTVADIFINDVLLKHVDNMHRRYRIPCTSVLKNGCNEIKIYFHSAIRYINEHIPQPGKEIHYTACGAMDNNQYIRKAHSMYGWDWGPQLPDLGIWRDIYIRGFAGASLEDVKIHQIHEAGKRQKSDAALEAGQTDLAERVQITAEVFVELADGERYIFSEAKEKIPQLRIEAELLTPQGERIDFRDGSCIVENPQLWWPNRYGSQPLYTVRAVLLWNGEVLNEKRYRIGLRTLTVSREKDEWGEEFAFCVNGVKIFAKGANYIPQDCIYARITPERIHSLLDTAVDSGFNCIRVWGGGYYPSDVFYDYCDEKGLIVWQDFMYACNVYELTEEFKENIIAETRDNVRRLRHHASLGLWCGNNEMESAWDHWGGFCDHSQALREDYLAMFEDILPATLREEDDVTFYWPSSPSSGGGFQDPDSDNYGDRHYWDVWHGEKPFTDYENYYFRFCSEFGFQSFPCMKTIREFTLPSDRNIFSEVMESHQKNGAANGKILRYISDNFLYPKDFQSLIYVSQVLQGLAIQEGVEHWRRHRGRCMGAIYWQLNDNWPVASWASIDYYGRWKALQYMARHFYADILGSLKVEEGHADKQHKQDGTLYKESDTYCACTPYVQNETLQDAQSEVVLFVKDMEGTILFEKSGHVPCKALSVAAMEPVYLQAVTSGKERDVFIEAVFRHSDGSVSRQVRMLRPYKHMRIKKAEITCSSVREGEQLIMTLRTDVPAFFVEIETEADMVLSDNFMHLTDGAEYIVTGQLPKGYKGIPGICVQSLCDSYEFPETE